MKNKALTAIILALFLSPFAVEAKTLYPERTYQTDWCVREGGVSEYTLDDNTRVDCLTEEYAVEADFAHKWAEAIGQSLYYSMASNRKPGILLIIENESEERFLKRLMGVAEKLGITVWVITPADLER